LLATVIFRQFKFGQRYVPQNILISLELAIPKLSKVPIQFGFL